jgi:hypothetical protein
MGKKTAVSSLGSLSSMRLSKASQDLNPPEDLSERKREPIQRWEMEEFVIQKKKKNRIPR